MAACASSSTAPPFRPVSRKRQQPADIARLTPRGKIGRPVRGNSGRSLHSRTERRQHLPVPRVPQVQAARLTTQEAVRSRLPSRGPAAVTRPRQALSSLASAHGLRPIDTGARPAADTLGDGATALVIGGGGLGGRCQETGDRNRGDRGQHLCTPPGLHQEFNEDASESTRRPSPTRLASCLAAPTWKS